MHKPHQAPDFLLQIAQEFHQVGFNSAVNAHKEPDKRLRHIVAGAVNMGFAAELLLKGLLLVTGRARPMVHKLNELFSCLDQSTREEIEMKFNEQQSISNSDEVLHSYYFTVTKEGEEKETYSSGQNLKSFLEVHSKTFETWRYVHEIPEDGFQYQMDFKSMNTFVQILMKKMDSIKWNGRFHWLEK